MRQDDRLIKEKIQVIQAELAEIERRRLFLQKQLAELETGALAVAEKPAPFMDVSHEISPEDQVRIFSSLFKGREDIFPKRWENRLGKSGYSPACRHEWVRDLCLKPRVRCSECTNREFIPLSDDVILQHLSGRIIAGIYPLLPDETTWFVAIDFDKKSWMEDITAFRETCAEKGLPIAVERSRSGNGAHVWFFFEKSLSARLARQFGCTLLTKTMERRHLIGLDSYDRLFPNQDTLPKGGFGNLIALPLQAGPRRTGNSVFIDSDFLPFADQWAFLQSVPRLSEKTAQRVVNEAAEEGTILGVRVSFEEETDEEPWSAPPSGKKRIFQHAYPLYSADHKM